MSLRQNDGHHPLKGMPIIYRCLNDAPRLSGCRLRSEITPREVWRRHFWSEKGPREVWRRHFWSEKGPREVWRRHFWSEKWATAVLPPYFRSENRPTSSFCPHFRSEMSPTGVPSPISGQKCLLRRSVPLFRRLFPLHRCFSRSVSERKRGA